MANKFNTKIIREFITSNYQAITLEVTKPKKQKINIEQLKNYMKVFDKMAEEKNADVYVVGRNEYGIKTIRSGDGRYYDDMDDYYNAKGYDQEKFDNFYLVEIIMGVKKQSEGQMVGIKKKK